MAAFGTLLWCSIMSTTIIDLGNLQRTQDHVNMPWQPYDIADLSGHPKPVSQQIRQGQVGLDNPICGEEALLLQLQIVPSKPPSEPLYERLRTVQSQMAQGVSRVVIVEETALSKLQ